MNIKMVMLSAISEATCRTTLSVASEGVPKPKSSRWSAYSEAPPVAPAAAPFVQLISEVVVAVGDFLRGGQFNFHRSVQSPAVSTSIRPHRPPGHFHHFSRSGTTSAFPIARRTRCPRRVFAGDIILIPIMATGIYRGGAEEMIIGRFLAVLPASELGP